MGASDVVDLSGAAPAWPAGGMRQVAQCKGGTRAQGMRPLTEAERSSQQAPNLHAVPRAPKSAIPGLPNMQMPASNRVGTSTQLLPTGPTPHQQGIKRNRDGGYDFPTPGEEGPGGPWLTPGEEGPGASWPTPGEEGPEVSWPTPGEEGPGASWPIPGEEGPGASWPNPGEEGPGCPWPNPGEEGPGCPWLTPGEEGPRAVRLAHTSALHQGLAGANTFAMCRRSFLTWMAGTPMAVLSEQGTDLEQMNGIERRLLRYTDDAAYCLDLLSTLGFSCFLGE
eukprot:gene22522-29644_t